MSFLLTFDAYPLDKDWLARNQNNNNSIIKHIFDNSCISIIWFHKVRDDISDIATGLGHAALQTGGNCILYAKYESVSKWGIVI